MLAQQSLTYEHVKPSFLIAPVSLRRTNEEGARFVGRVACTGDMRCDMYLSPVTILTELGKLPVVALQLPPIA